MSNTIDFILTNAAYELISKVLSGKTLNFTRMAVGDGFSYDTTIAKGYTTLVNEVLSLDITKKETLSTSSVKITSVLKNTDAEKEFYYREVGLYAQDPDTGKEVLYAYGNRNDAAELITPIGSSVVTKQLIFIIAVGDSANVTFNVNADVYALQEDMIEVQADITQIQTNLGNTQTNISSLQTELNQANTNIIALQTNKADKNFVNTGVITNCLLEVPQRIKYEHSSEGALTIKAGTVLIFPFGTEAPTLTKGNDFYNSDFKVVDYQYNNGLLFYWVEMQSDIAINYGSFNNNLVLAIERRGAIIALSENCTSGTNAPTTNIGRQFWYDTTKNFIYNYPANSTTAESIVLSFPIMIFNCTATNTFTLNHIFNGIGYLGKTFWVDKGIKGLSPNGFNYNGTLNNTEWEYTSLYVRTMENETDIHFIGLNGFDISRINTVGSRYDPEKNLNLLRVNEKWSYTFYCKCLMTNGKISNLEPMKPLHIADHNMLLKKINELESRISALEVN